ncbi:MAG: DUF4177 domain-containing protein [Litoreibacter sp.]
MSGFEYKVVAAPRKGVSAKGIKGSDGKFANALTKLMNEMSADGWYYLRSDTLPCDERQGLTGKTTKYHAMLVFQRPRVEAPVAPPVEEPKQIAPPKREEPVLEAPETVDVSPDPSPDADAP